MSTDEDVPGCSSKSNENPEREHVDIYKLHEKIERLEQLLLEKLNVNAAQPARSSADGKVEHILENETSELKEAANLDHQVRVLQQELNSVKNQHKKEMEMQESKICLLEEDIKKLTSTQPLADGREMNAGRSIENLNVTLPISPGENSCENWVSPDSLRHVWNARPIDTSNFKLKSESFPLIDYRMRATAKAKSTNFALVLSLKFFKDVSGKPVYTYPPRVTYLLKSPTGRDLIRSTTKLHRHYMHLDKYDYKTDLCPKVALPNYLWSGETFVIEIHVESFERVTRVLPTYGDITMQIDNYEEKRQLAVEGRVYSQISSYFLSHAKGYRLQVEVFLNGAGAFVGKGVTVMVKFVSTNHVFRYKSVHRATVSILHPRMSIIKSVEKDVWAEHSYCVDMATHSELQRGGHLLANTLNVKVSIDFLDAVKNFLFYQLMHRMNVK